MQEPYLLQRAMKLTLANRRTAAWLIASILSDVAAGLNALPNASVELSYNAVAFDELRPKVGISEDITVARDTDISF